MKVVALEIRKRNSFDNEYPNEIVGVVQIIGSTGKIEVKLSPKTVSEIFRLCIGDVERVSKYNAEQAPISLQNAADEMDLRIANGDTEQQLLPF